MDSVQFNYHRINRKYVIIGIILYIPVITLNIMTYITLYNIKNNINNLISNQENTEYINKVKYLVDYVCNIVSC